MTSHMGLQKTSGHLTRQADRYYLDVTTERLMNVLTF